MKLTAVLVESLDGFITRAGDSNIYDWTSAEDSQQFFSEVRRAKLVLMGLQTYLAAKPRIILSPNTLRIVLTSQPEKFAAEAVSNQLEFLRISPMDLFHQLEAKGYETGLIVGGAKTLASFLSAGLVAELKITIEPILLGAGQPLAEALPTGFKLKLTDLKQLNAKGTLLLTYDLV